MTPPVRTPRSTTVQGLALAAQALRVWTSRQVIAAAVAAGAVGLVIGLVTVLIPNPVFGRDILPVWWNYPVWILTSALSGLLIATYVRAGGPEDEAEGVAGDEALERRTGRMGVAGGILAWFAVGCPVCNKLALLALGYSGAITWFTPIQPFLAIGAMILSAVALVWRLRGQVACPVTPNATAVQK